LQQLCTLILYIKLVVVIYIIVIIMSFSLYTSTPVNNVLSLMPLSCSRKGLNEV